MTDDSEDIELPHSGSASALPREAEAAAGPVLVAVAELPALGYLLAHHRRLIEQDNKRRADLRAAQQKAGRRRTDNPAPSTLRARASRPETGGKEGPVTLSPEAALHRRIWQDLHAEYLGSLRWREIDRLAAYRWRRATGIRSDDAASRYHREWIVADQIAATLTIRSL